MSIVSAWIMRDNGIVGVGDGSIVGIRIRERCAEYGLRGFHGLLWDIFAKPPSALRPTERTPELSQSVE